VSNGANPDYNSLLAELWGWPDEGGPAFATLSAASNVVVGTNPPYALTDFLGFYPQFGSYGGSPPTYTGPLPAAVINAYIALASASVQQARWCEAWAIGMANFVAHYCTLYLRCSGDLDSSSPTKKIVAAGLAKGVTISQGAGDLSESRESLKDDLAGFGQWRTTAFGEQFATMAKIFGAGGMVIY